MPSTSLCVFSFSLAFVGLRFVTFFVVHVVCSKPICTWFAFILYDHMCVLVSWFPLEQRWLSFRGLLCGVPFSHFGFRLCVRSFYLIGVLLFPSLKLIVR